MDENKLRHVGKLTGICAIVSVVIGLAIQFVLRLILMNNVEGVHFAGLELLGVLKSIFMMALMGGGMGFLLGLFSKPDESKKAPAGADGSKDSSPEADEAARETLAKLGIPTDKPDSSSK